MSLSDSRLGPYTILAPLGAGGMGEVYRAADTRLKRQVAIKILPAALAADPDRLARFQREAEVLASLNHPNIAAVYGLEESGDLKALVMELVEGPTLADRIEHGRIPFDEALPIARQIADALEAAHEQGVVHRDLKPANIKVRDDGAVKVLDFGLAKLTESKAAVRPAVDLSQSPTLINPAAPTGVGIILGTAAYMSPEQARGRTVDKRTDVWAFGAVLFEMLSGTRAFEGEDVTELMASVVKSTPNWAALPPDVPPPVVTLIQRCLEKDRGARIGDIAVARFLLSDHAAIAMPDPKGPRRTRDSSSPAPLESGRSPDFSRPGTAWRRIAPWAAAALLAGALLGWLLPRRSMEEARPVEHLLMDVQPAESLAPNLNTGIRPSRLAFAISPDGGTVAFAGVREHAIQLYLHPLNRPAAMPIPGTDGAAAPFFSPDGAWIGFVADNKIKKLATSGGPPTTVCDLPTGPFWGASWAEDGTIFFAARPGVFKVSAAGGNPQPVTTADQAKFERHLLPQPLPGGKELLVTMQSNVAIVSLDTGKSRTIIERAADARYVPSGHLVFMRNGTLMAVPFDPRTAHVTEAPVALIDGVMQGVNAGNGNDETNAGQFAFSASGTLLYATGGIFSNLATTLMWVDRKGIAQPVPGLPVQAYLYPRLSPDGRKVAVEIRREASRATDIWVYDVVRGSLARLTFEGGGIGAWSPDGKRLAYSFATSGASNVYAMNVDRSGTPERLTTSDRPQSVSSWSPGADALSIMQRPTPDTFGLWVLPMAGAARQPTLFLESRFLLTHPMLSPDGQWMTYTTNESGASEVYIRANPGPGETIKISNEGGYEPIWTANGREILYRAFARTGLRFMSVAVRSLSPLQIDPPRLLFEAPLGTYDSTTPLRSWDATADGQRFLLVRVNESTDKPVTSVHVVLNWADELKRRVK